MRSDKPLVLTLGDPAGIGPEIIAKLYRDHASSMRGTFVAGDRAALARGARCIVRASEPPLPLCAIESPEDAFAAPPGAIPFLQIGEPQTLVPLGQISAGGGDLAARCVIWAARAALRGDVGALVTAPLNKEALSAAGYPYPGHTELLQAEAAAFAGCAIEAMPVRMMLANDELRVVLVSIHVALRQAIDALTVQAVGETIAITQAALTRQLGRAPRIAVAGLNPHAGEGGLFGREEIDIVAPAIARARAGGVDVHGPFAPDTVFMRARRGEFDVVVALYHDQGLIPVKYLGVEQGVNVTLGLPLIRTSPDHGTAFDIAGSGRADPSSLLAAVQMARRAAA